MALVYRAHFALATRPIYSSKGVNTSALFGFTQTLLDVLAKQQPTHIAVALDTDVPTHRHTEFPDYKAQREAMPEDIAHALPQIRRLLAAFNIPLIICDGFEADDIIGTLVRVAEKHGFVSYMVTPDKDFGQLVSSQTFLYKPARMGDAIEILGVPEILAKWGIQRPEQVIDILGLWGDTSDNIPGVPGIGEKTASKLITQYGSVENLLDHAAELKGKLKETLESNREQALLSKRLATIHCSVPCDLDLEKLKVQPANEDALKTLFVEFEFNSIGRRMFGADFRAGHGYEAAPAEPAVSAGPPWQTETGDLFEQTADAASAIRPTAANLKSLPDFPHQYGLIKEAADRAELVRDLLSRERIAISLLTDGSETKDARPLLLALSVESRVAKVVPLPQTPGDAARVLQEFQPLFANPAIEWVGHDLKFVFGVLRWHGCTLAGRAFDLMLAHSLIEPDMRHNLEYLAEAYLGYTPLPRHKPGAGSGELDLAGTPPEEGSDRVAEAADLAWQLREVLEPLLETKGQKRVFYEIETPLLPALVEMEYEGIRIDSAALADFSQQLQKQMSDLEGTIYKLAGMEFNLNSPKQLGEILFDTLRLAEKPKKTKTGQYATSEQVLLTLAADHEIVRRLLDYRECTKLKSTYVDALPQSVFPKSGRVHTTYQQAATTTGRLNSNNPNLQNIPIRSEQGKEIRKAFVPRDSSHTLLAADYSQIELRIIAAISQETAMLEAFQSGVDIHTATASKVYGVFLDLVTPEMRRKAKMVNFGIAYGISAFGLAQRLAISRKEASQIIDQYFAQYPRIAKYMRDTVEFCVRHGYVETVTGRRRYLRDITSSNGTVRSAAERNAINAPIQGTAADMIKIAMARIHAEIMKRGLKTRMLLQVHDELVFDLYLPEKEQAISLIREKMKTAIDLKVPLEVEIGTGENWLVAH